jgi:diaminobutyrate acetyltransferase
MKSPPQNALALRTPTVRDGADLWRLVRELGTLELNSAYAYLLFCERFAETCQLAFLDARLTGFVLGFRPPQQPDSVFVWQIGVHLSARGAGLGSTLLRSLVQSEGCRGVRFLEAHVDPGNQASDATFRAFARRTGADLQLSEGYDAELFPSAHAPERLLRIGPFQPSATQFDPARPRPTIKEF